MSPGLDAQRGQPAGDLADRAAEVGVGDRRPRRGRASRPPSSGRRRRGPARRANGGRRRRGVGRGRPFRHNPTSPVRPPPPRGSRLDRRFSCAAAFRACMRATSRASRSRLSCIACSRRTREPPLGGARTVLRHPRRRGLRERGDRVYASPARAWLGPAVAGAGAQRRVTGTSRCSTPTAARSRPPPRRTRRRSPTARAVEAGTLTLQACGGSGPRAPVTVHRTRHAGRGPGAAARERRTRRRERTSTG